MKQQGGIAMLNQIIDVLTILIALLPLGITIFQLVTAKTHNVRIKNLSQRSQIIVEALNQSNLTNEDKKQAALVKLAKYAKEVNIGVTADQLEDYIESAVAFVKVVAK